MYGKVLGRIFLQRDLGIIDGDDTPDTVTLSELVETYPYWEEFTKHIPFKTKQLVTMFETSDVHPDIIEAMKHFDRVIVPFPYLREILEKHGVNAHSIDFWTSELIRERPKVIEKIKNPERLIFLYIGTNDVRKNLKKLVSTFVKHQKHLLIVKTNTDEGLVQSPHVKIITGNINTKQMASLYNMCDYVISFTRGEGVGMPMLEANYFRKPIIAHDQGVFRDIKKLVDVPWYTLSSKEVPIDYSEVPLFLKNVFYGSWWEVDDDLTEIFSRLLE